MRGDVEPGFPPLPFWNLSWTNWFRLILDWILDCKACTHNAAQCNAHFSSDFGLVLNEVWVFFREIWTLRWLCPALCSRVSSLCPFPPTFLFIPKSGIQRGQWMCEDSAVDEEWKQTYCFTKWGCGRMLGWEECLLCLAAVHAWISRRIHTLYIYLLGAVSGSVVLAFHNDKYVFLVTGIFSPRSGLPLWAINQCHCDPEVSLLYRNSTLKARDWTERMRSRKEEPQHYLFNLNGGRKPVIEEVCFICTCAFYGSSLSVLFETIKITTLSLYVFSEIGSTDIK